MQPPPSIRPTSAPPLLRRTRRSSSSAHIHPSSSTPRCAASAIKEKASASKHRSHRFSSPPPPRSGRSAHRPPDSSCGSAWRHKASLAPLSNSTMRTSAPARRLLRYRYCAALIARRVTSDGASTYPSSIHEPNKAETPPHGHGAAGSMRSKRLSVSSDRIDELARLVAAMQCISLLEPIESPDHGFATFEEWGRMVARGWRRCTRPRGSFV